MSTTFPSTMTGGIMATARRAERWLDDRGRFAWFLAVIAGFALIWPVGLALLAYVIWSKRMFNRTNSARNGRGKCCGDRSMTSVWQSSGNMAFDAYKADTLRRLEQEQQAFEAFLQRLRDAKDKSQFDTFMDERARGVGETTPDEAAPQASTAEDDRRGAY